MPSLGALLHLLSLLVADAIGRLAGLAWPAGSASQMCTQGRLDAASTEQRDRELPVARHGRPRGVTAESCAFCLSGIEDGDEVRVLRCAHLFHRCCLDRWLVARPGATCPLCRGKLLVAATCNGEEDGEEEGVTRGTAMAAFMAYVCYA